MLAPAQKVVSMADCFVINHKFNSFKHNSYLFAHNVLIWTGLSRDRSLFHVAWAKAVQLELGETHPKMPGRLSLAVNWELSWVFGPEVSIFFHVYLLGLSYNMVAGLQAGRSRTCQAFLILKL
jgi:hypothetical protein